MNLHAGNLTGIAAGRKRNRHGENKGILVFLLCYFVPLLVATFFALNYWVNIRAETERMNRECTRIQREIHRLDREILNQKVERERLGSWKHIGRMIQKMKLPLTSPNPMLVSNLHGPITKSDVQAVASRRVTPDGTNRDSIKSAGRKVR